MNNAEFTGWRNQPNGRGTFDILKDCLGTIFLLCWSSTCPSVPGPRSGFWSKWKGKLDIFLLAMFGPDFIFGLAVAQLNAAWNARAEFRRRGKTTWKLKHCFFVNMGGIHVQFPDRELEGKHSFPVDCGQLLYLVDHGYMDLPSLTEADIEDRNKSDELARAITAVQSVWFTIQSFGRISQGLYITTLELTTLGFIFMMLISSFAWWRKPMDVSRPIVEKVATDLKVILTEANAPSPERGQTPLSFITRREWVIPRVWTYYSQMLKNIFTSPSKQREKRQPVNAESFPALDLPLTDLKWEPYLILFPPVYAAIFCAAWNFAFPTEVERILWRVASLVNLGFCTVGLWIAWYVAHHVRLHEWLRAKAARLGIKAKSAAKGVVEKPKTMSPRLQRWDRRLDWMRNLTLDHDPVMSIQARMWIPLTLSAVVYTMSRLYILVEDLIGLRKLPVSAYQTVNWAQYSPIF